MDPRRARLDELVHRCGRRAFAVAHSLLRDADEALDAVQQAYLVAARKAERIPHDDPWPWFGVVVAHEARNMRRKRRPHTNAPQEGTDMRVCDAAAAGPGARTEREEERRRVRDALDALPVGEREAVTLIHMAGMTHAAAAEALGLPRQTLSSAVRRGLERLGRRLRQEPAGVTRALAVLPVAAPSCGWEAATEIWLKTALGGLAPAATATGTTLGGVALMSSKTLLVLTLTVAVGAGFLGGTYWNRSDRGEPAGSRPDASLALMSADAPPSGSPTLGAAPTSGEVAALRQEVAALRNRLARAEGSEAGAAKPASGSTFPARAGPTFTFGSMGRLDAVREADWREMAQASAVVEDGVRALLGFKERGEEAPSELRLRLQENVEKMRKYEYRTIGKIPTAAKYNGELTHPITMANLLAAILAGAGLPLDEEQVARINRLGLAFDADFERTRDRYTDTTPRVRRILDEYRLKGRFADDIIAVLTPEQRAKAVNAETKGIAGLDLNNPTLMILHTSPVLVGGDLDEIAGKLRTLLTDKLTLADADAPALDRALDAWRQEVRGLLAPVPRTRLPHYTYAEGDRAAAATLALTNRLLEDLELSDAARAILLDDYAIYVPRVPKT